VSPDMSLIRTTTRINHFICSVVIECQEIDSVELLEVWYASDHY